MEQDRFEKLYREHGASVVRYCTFSAGSWQDGEDIAAEVFSRLVTKGDGIADAHVAPWLFTVARNLCRSHHRAARRRQHLNDRIARGSAPTAPAWTDPALWRYLAALNERSRLVVYLHAVEGRPFGEIAALTASSTSAVKMTHYRALERLRRSMAADGVTRAADLLGGPNDA